MLRPNWRSRSWGPLGSDISAPFLRQYGGDVMKIAASIQYGGGPRIYNLRQRHFYSFYFFLELSCMGKLNIRTPSPLQLSSQQNWVRGPVHGWDHLIHSGMYAFEVENHIINKNIYIIIKHVRSALPKWNTISCRILLKLFYFIIKNWCLCENQCLRVYYIYKIRTFSLILSYRNLSLSLFLELLELSFEIEKQF